MDTRELTTEQRMELLKELGRHYVVDTPPFEKCACGDSMAKAGHDIGTHRLEAAFLFGIKVGRRPKPRRKVIPASEVKVNHEIMSARRRVLVTNVIKWTTPRQGAHGRDLGQLQAQALCAASSRDEFSRAGRA